MIADWGSDVLVPIVEGHAEVEAVPVLMRRLLAESGQYEVEIARPVRVKRYKVVRLHNRPKLSVTNSSHA